MFSLLLKARRWWIALTHMGIFAISVQMAFLLRFDGTFPEREVPGLWFAVPAAVVIKSVHFAGFGLFRGWWQYATIRDLVRIAAANVAGSVVFTAACLWMIPSFARSVYVADLLICFLLSAGARFAVRIYNDALVADLSGRRRARGLLIYGAGAAGVALLRDIRRNTHAGYEVIGFVDDDPAKTGEQISGARVLGTGRDIRSIVELSRTRVPSVDEIVIAMPSATRRQTRAALAHCRETRLPCRTIPRIDELLDTRRLISQVRDVSVEDLLCRDTVQLDSRLIRSHLEGRAVLVTGAAGSIGSELCRQVLGFGPRLLVALDQSETPLFHLEAELRRRFPDAPVVARIGDIRNKRRLSEIIAGFDVEWIFHAAAYKHVPVMEANIAEAVRNNIIGTWNLVSAAREHRVGNLVLISSDKAVNPSSIMGLTKRVAELVISATGAADTTAARFVAVRFGNVLGSNGSVIPIFREQILAGGPVTVTDPDARRYFMTIREAVQLVLQAAVLGKRSEIFVLDMGEPVRIVDLARNMIRLSGFEPDDDVPIVFTGLRPGEKLFEELRLADETVLPTHHPKIHIVRCATVAQQTMQAWIARARQLLRQGRERELMEHVVSLVPEYAHPPASSPSTPAEERRIAVAGKG